MPWEPEDIAHYKKEKQSEAPPSKRLKDKRKYKPTRKHLMDRLKQAKRDYDFWHGMKLSRDDTSLSKSTIRYTQMYRLKIIALEKEIEEFDK